MLCLDRLDPTISRLDVELDVLQQMLGVVFKVPLKCAGVHYGSCCEQHFLSRWSDWSCWETIGWPQQPPEYFAKTSACGYSSLVLALAANPYGSELVKTVQVIGYVIGYVHHWDSPSRMVLSKFWEQCWSKPHCHCGTKTCPFPFNLTPSGRHGSYAQSICGCAARGNGSNGDLPVPGLAVGLSKVQASSPKFDFWMEPDLSPNRSCNQVRCTQDPGSASGVGSWHVLTIWSKS